MRYFSCTPGFNFGATTSTGHLIFSEQYGTRLDGPVGFNGSTPVAKAANPDTASGTDANVINSVVTALRNVGIVT